MASILKQLVTRKGENTQTIRGSTKSELDYDPKMKPEEETELDSFNTLPAQPQSPSPEAEYDKLLVSKTTKLTMFQQENKCFYVYIKVCFKERSISVFSVR